MKQLLDAPLQGTQKHQNKWTILARDKHFSLLRKSVNYGRKKFYNNGFRLIGLRREWDASSRNDVEDSYGQGPML